MEQKNERGRVITPRIDECMKSVDNLMNGSGKNKGAVVKLYLTNFKSYNDAFGYRFGGRLINEITAFLESVKDVEAYNIRGVEYILLIKASSRRTISEALDEIMRRFDDAWHIDNVICTCSVNGGIVYLPGDAATPNEVLEQLSTAIAESILIGQNHIVEYDSVLIKKYQRRNAIAQRIPQALQDGSIETWFWPTYQVSAKKYARIDCNLRMHCQGLGLIQEAELISVAEQSGQIGAISRFVVSRMCGLISELISQNKEFETVGVRLSLVQLLQDRFIRDLADIIEEAGIPADRLAFEVNEATANSSFSRIYMCMGELSEMGIEMILSDFGTGSLGIYSILSMSINTVKIDKQLIAQMESMPNGTALLDSLISLSKSFGLKLVAEGVGTAEQARLLEELGCDYQKGVYYNPALTSDGVISILPDAGASK